MLTAQYPGDDTTPSLPLRADFESAMEAYGLGRDIVQQVLFGDGGVYSRTLLGTREHMLHRLQFAVQGVARNLELLDRSLVKLLVAPPTAASASAR